ncbi:MAG: PUA domain-containing protein [Promethearchaeati archaeon SRVP18_Atabeyarchaeia-1]
MSAIEFGSISVDERATIMESIDTLLGKDVASNVIGRLEIVVARGKRTELFLVPAEVMNVFKRTRNRRNPYCLGIYLGDLKNDDLLLSIEGITLCSPYTEKKVKVSDKGEQSVLYGRDISRALVDDYPSSITKGDRVVVVNRLGEPLALGKALIDGDKFRNSDVSLCVLENILDRGWYLRKGK